jgi:low affinity Fe/Cu permease
MPRKPKKKRENVFERFSGIITKATGSPAAFLLALGVIIAWAISGPFFGFSDTWQLVINTSTTIITFLMVFIIQQSQNKDTVAIHIKLNELIAATKGASNRLIDVEDLSENELKILKRFYVELSDLAEKEDDITSSHSVEEASENHQEKRSQRPAKRKKA